MSDLASQAAHGAFVTLVAQGSRFVLRFGSMIVLARLLTPEAFGIVAMATAVVGVAEIIRDFGLSSAAMQAERLTHGQRSNLFWVNLGIGSLCAVAAAGASGAIAALYGEPLVAGVVLALAPLMIVSGANTQFRAELSRELRFRALARTDVTAQAASVVAALVAAGAGAGYWAIVLQQVVLVIGTFLGNWLQCPWRPGWYSRGDSIRALVRYGGGVVGTQVLGYVTNNVDNVAIGAVWGAGPLGLYTRAYQLLLVPLEQVDAAMTKVVLPVLARVKNDSNRLVRYVTKAQLVNCYLLCTGFALAAALAQPLVALLFGSRWLQVAPIFAVLAIGGIFRSLNQVVYWVFLATGRTGAQLRLYLVLRPAMIAMMMTGLPWGPMGVAVGHSVGFGFSWIVSMWYAGRATGVSMRPVRLQALQILLMLSLPVGLLALIGWWWAGPGWQGVLLGAGLAATYAVVSMLLIPSRRSDAGELVRIVRRAVRQDRS